MILIAKYLRVSEFAQLCGIPRKTLIFYDEIDLLKPERVTENGYRYYTGRQMEPASVISALREIGMSLPDIKSYLRARNPQAFVELLTEQKKVMAAKMDRLRRIEAMLDTRLALTRRALEASPSTIEVRHCPAEPLFVSDIVDCTSEETAEQAAYDFYDFCDEKGMTYGYPLGDIIPRRTLESDSEALWPQRYFFKYPPAEHHSFNAEKPEGLYLICCERAYYSLPRKSYGHLFRYMEEHGYVLAGDAYEEFLLDEIATTNQEEFMLQISIQIKPKP